MARLERYNHYLQLATELARIKRTEAATTGNIAQIKEVLNTMFGPIYNQINNLSPLTALRAAKVSLGITADQIERDDELADRFWDAIKQHLVFNGVIHFPEIVITNSNQNSHIIRDLFVRFFFDYNGTICQPHGVLLQGLRTTATPLEIQGHYSHSHLQGTMYASNQFQNFCLGAGPIKLTGDRLHENFDREDFILFCLHIKELVKWESLEGRPFKRIAELMPVVSNSDVEHIEDVSQVCEILFEQIRSLSVPEVLGMLNISLSAREIIIHSTREFEKYLVGVMQRHPSLNIAQNFALLTSRGSYQRIDSRPEEPVSINTNRVVLVFNNQPLRLKIHNDEEEQEREDYYPNPFITEGVIKHIQKKFNNYWFTKELLVPAVPAGAI